MNEIALKAFARHKIKETELVKAIRFFTATITFVELEILNNETDMQDDDQIELLEMCEIALIALEGHKPNGL